MQNGEEESGAVDLEAAGKEIEKATAAALLDLEDGGVAVTLEALQRLVRLQESRSDEGEAPAEPETTAVEVGQLQQAKMEVEALRKIVQPEVSKEAGVPMVQHDGFEPEEAIESCLKKLKPAIHPSLRMPWEIGFAGVVLNGNVSFYSNEILQNKSLSPEGIVPQVEEAMPEVESKEPAPAPTFRFPARGEKKEWKIEEKDRREKAFRRWLVVLRAMGDASPVTAMVETTGEEVMEDIFAKKKTGTLEVRSSAMLLYVRWCQSKGFPPFPISEDLCYIYVDELRKNNAPATRSNSFRSALAFCKGTFMIDGVDSVLASSRVSGSAHRSFLNKRLLRQRDALTVDQVSVLEHLLTSEAPVQDRMFAGHCLLCVYGRLRFGDSQCIEEEPEEDDEYVECGMTMHKTSHLVGRARRVLPVVAMSVGVSGTEWGKAYLDLRASEGIRAWPTLPFFPSPIMGGGWSRGRLSTTEASMWLCELLHRCGVPKERLTNIGAHSPEGNIPQLDGQSGDR